MKKILFWMLVMGIMVLPNMAKAEVTDNTGPTLNSFEFATTTFYNNRTVDVTIDAIDDVTGVSSFNFIFKSEKGDASLHVFVPAKNGNKTYTSQSLEKVDTGKYKLFTVYAYDGVYNSSCYVTEEYKNEMSNCQTIDKSLEVEVKDPDDMEYPKIESINISKTNITPGEEITFSANTDKSNISSVVFNYGRVSVAIYSQGNNNSFIKTANNFDAPGTTYELISLTVSDTNGTCTTYTNTTYGDTCNKDNSIDLSQYNITVSGDSDSIPPELKSIEVLNDGSKVLAPGVLKLKVVANDNIPNNIKRMQINIYKKGVTNHGYSNAECNGDGNEFNCTLDINQYFDTGTYHITSLYLFDKSDNMSYYTIDPKFEKEKKLDEVEFVVDTDTKSDVVSSTINDTILDKIRDANGDATISLDSTKNPIVKKEIFDAIKDTNKKLIVESNGIQWIFTGSKITNETKDINVSVNIYQNFAKDDNSALNSVNSVMIDFAKNGLLPGIVKVRIKADYVFRDFIGVTDLDVYYYDDEDELLDAVAKKVDLTEDGYYEFYIEHNSKYMITNIKPEKKYISDDTKYLVINNVEVENVDYDVNEEDVVTIGTEEEVKEEEKKTNNTLLITIICCLVVAIVIIICLIVKKKIKLKKAKFNGK